MTELLRPGGPQIPPTAGGIRGRRPSLTTRRRETAAGWLMSAPVIVLLVVFLVAPIVMAAWVSLSDWNGIGSPFASGVHAVGAKNYEALLTQPGLPQQQLGESLRNNLYYVILVVPVQTALALGLALFVQPAAAHRTRFLPHRLLLPLDHQLGGGVDPVPVHLRRPPAWSTRSSATSAAEQAPTGSMTRTGCSR